MNYKYSPPLWLKTLTSGYVLWGYTNKVNKIFLTFDDGPDPDVTPGVLDLLGEYNARATFFLHGQKAAAYPELLARITREGHSIGNHTWSHPDGWKTSTSDYIKDVELCAEVVPSGLFRPPYGRLRLRQLIKLRRKGFKVVMWSFLTGDFEQNVSRDILLKRSLQTIGPGSIVVLHDSPKAAANCLFLLEALLYHFSRRGFSFECIDKALIRKTKD